MIALLQRVAEASVTVEGQCIGRIARGLMVLLCAERGDIARMHMGHERAGRLGQLVRLDAHRRECLLGERWVRHCLGRGQQKLVDRRAQRLHLV